MTRDERLKELVSIVNGVYFGMPGYDQRLSEMCSGFSSRGDGGGAKGNVSRPVEQQVIANMDEHRRDPAAEAQTDFDRRLSGALREAEALWEEYKRVAQPKLGVSKVTDPGCDLCSAIPCGCERCKALDSPHWCATRYTVERKEEPKPNRRGQQPKVHRFKLCSSCYEFQRDDRAGRLPTHDEVLDHAEGRRRRWKVGA